MKISLVTPAGKKSRTGNRTTAVRWARILRNLGHRVAIAEQDDGAEADIMVAVHAWRSYHSIKSFSVSHPNRPLVVLLAGTDIYSFQHTHPNETLDSMNRATALVCLHRLVEREIPQKYVKKLNVIYQSAKPLLSPSNPNKKTFDICVIGHLRDEKDPLRAAYASRLAPRDSKIRIIHLGKAHNQKWLNSMRAEEDANPRFISLGDVPAWRVRRQFSTSRAMVISSIMEGGANVVSEAVVAGLPIIASEIDGNIGLLGPDYKGYYPAKDTKALASLLNKLEEEPGFLRQLAGQIKKRQNLFRPSREHQAWDHLINHLRPSL